MLAEHCADFHLPFDLMIGVNRAVYQAGVFQGQDLYDSRVSLIQYRELFNGFPQVVFPISVLASVTNQELASYSWIFPNVVTNGHWWYSNTPTFIEHDTAARLEAVPRTKQIGYYSDMYKLEFALPKFAMYKRILAKVLAERYCRRPRLERRARPGTRAAGAAWQRREHLLRRVACDSRRALGLMDSMSLRKRLTPARSASEGFSGPKRMSRAAYGKSPWSRRGLGCQR